MEFLQKEHVLVVKVLEGMLLVISLLRISSMDRMGGSSGLKSVWLTSQVVTFLALAIWQSFPEVDRLSSMFGNGDGAVFQIWKIWEEGWRNLEDVRFDSDLFSVTKLHGESHSEGIEGDYHNVLDVED